MKRLGHSKCRGMRDLLPEDMARFRAIEDVFRSCCLKYGYQEVRTPLLEHLHLFTATGTLTPSMLGKVYSFLDWDGWSGERVVLRPDGTIPIARLYVDNLGQRDTAKLCYVTDIFSFEETVTKNRERWQCGAEFLGGSRLLADGETISLAMEVVQRLGIRDARLQISHAGLVKALISELNLDPEQEGELVDRVLDGDWDGLMTAGSAVGQLGRLMSQLLNLKGKSRGFLENAKSLYQGASQRLKESLDDFIGVSRLLDSLNYRYEIDITAIQGFEYYTGVYFQLMANGEKVGGGGRYDDLIPMMSGKQEPACGFALYVEPLMKLLPPETIGVARARVLVRSDESAPGSLGACCVLAKALRQEDYATEVGLPDYELAGYEWIVSVSDADRPAFNVVNCAKAEEWSAASVDEVLRILRS
jgi:histidyl-tRNA synthetase